MIARTDSNLDSSSMKEKNRGERVDHTSTTRFFQGPLDCKLDVYMQSDRIEAFWKWFVSYAEQISAEPDCPALVEELDRRVSELHKDISWEIGPGRFHALAACTVSVPEPTTASRRGERGGTAAPNVTDWAFFPARRPKDWDYKVVLKDVGSEPVLISATAWRFVMLRYSDGQYQIILEGQNMPAMSEDRCWQAAAITLESILGEDVLMDKVCEFSLVRELTDDLAAKAAPIQQLSTVLTRETQGKTS